MKPRVPALNKKKSLDGSEARRREKANDSILAIVEGRAFAPVFRSAEISLSPGGRDESLTLEPASGTLLPLRTR